MLACAPSAAAAAAQQSTAGSHLEIPGVLPLASVQFTAFSALFLKGEVLKQSNEAGKHVGFQTL